MPTGQRIRIDISWREHARCRTAPLGLFFPDSNNGIEEIQEAKGLCLMCPVQSECLEYSLVTNQENGHLG